MKAVPQQKRLHENVEVAHRGLAVPGPGAEGGQQGYKPQEEPETEKESAGPKKDDVIDAEFTEEDDKGKKGKK